MDKKDIPKTRRPLPTPGAPAQRPNTPVQSTTPVPTKTFYGTPSHKSPALPNQPYSGSAYTTYVPPIDPPSYVTASQSSSNTSDAMAITEEFKRGDLPSFNPTEAIHTAMNNDSDWPNSNWSNDISKGWATDDSPWSAYPPASAWTNSANSTLDLESLEYMSPTKSSGVQIDARSTYEELNWWDPSVRQKCLRPGPGMLPPLLAENLHDPEHSIFSVTVTSPNIQFPNPVIGQLSNSSETKLTVPASSSRNDPPNASIPPQPTEEDVRTAVPHPNAYYCPRENGWIVLSWKSSSMAPPLAQSFIDASHPPLPDQTRRKRTNSCIGETNEPFGQLNKTHHFHKYEKAIDAHKLTPPYRRDEWDLESIKMRRRVQRVINVDMQELKVLEGATDGAAEEPDEGRLLDLYVCCQCSFYCVASGTIPGVIPRKHFEEFIRDKRENPPPGKTGEQAVVQAFETILLCVH